MTALLASYTGVSIDVQAENLNEEVIQEEESKPESLSGWVEENGTYSYYNVNGEAETGWIQVGKNWYYMNADGAMQTSWNKIGGKWYYQLPSGAMDTGWRKVGKNWYYFQDNAVMQTGWMRHGNKTYYMNSSGVMQTGKVYIDSSDYSFDAKGALDLGDASSKPSAESDALFLPVKNPSFIPPEAILVRQSKESQVFIYEKELVGGGKIEKVFINRYSDVVGYGTIFSAAATIVDEVGDIYVCSIGIDDRLGALVINTYPVLRHGQMLEMEAILLNFRKAYVR